MNRPADPGTVTKPPAKTVANHWALGAQTDELRTSATVWKTVGDAFTREQGTFTRAVTATMPSWDADNGADFQKSYAGEQASGLTDMAGACLDVHATLTGLAGQLDEVQRSLDASLGRVTSAMPHENLGIFGIDPLIVFHPEDAADVSLIDKETGTADGLLADARQHVSTANTALGRAPTAFARLHTAWSDEAGGVPVRWAKHPAGSSSYRTVQTVGGTTIVSGTAQDEHVRVEIDPATGETVLIFSRITTVDLDPDPKKTDNHYKYVEEQRIRVPAGQDVVLNTGQGNDQVEVPKGVNVKLRVMLGEGDDQLQGREAQDRVEAFAGQGNDRIITGHGADFVSTGDGDDYADGGSSADQIFGGAGNDSLYGLDGNDLVSGGDGRDTIDAGAGNDIAFGGDGADVVGGGHDDDQIFGGAGDDHVYAGQGDDTMDGGVDIDAKGLVTGDDDQLTGTDAATDVGVETDRTVTIQYDGNLGGFIKVEGSPEFQARVNSDLEFMRSTPTGQQMLRKLTELHENTDNPWNPFDHDNNYTIKEFDPTAAYDNAYESGGDGGSDVTVTYRPEWTGLDGSNDDPDYNVTPPVVVLYHEMGHSYQFMSGTEAHGRTKQGAGTVNSVERQNVGLSYSENDKPSDDTDNGLAPDHDEDPDQHVYRENGLRDELGIPDRTDY